VALTLLAQRGFDSTSTAQIAEATGIAAQDVARIIGTKDAIVLNVAGAAVLTDVVKALADVDPQTPVVEALLAAHSSLLGDIIDGTGPVTLQRLKSMSLAITSSPELQKKVAAQRIEMLSDVLADHFGTSMADRSVQQGLKVWSAEPRRRRAISGTVPSGSAVSGGSGRTTYRADPRFRRDRQPPLRDHAADRRQDGRRTSRQRTAAAAA